MQEDDSMKKWCTYFHSLHVPYLQINDAATETCSRYRTFLATDIVNGRGGYSKSQILVSNVNHLSLTYVIAITHVSHK